MHAMLYALGEQRPEIAAEDCYVAPTAVLIGSVRLAPGASVWWGAVLRGDNEPISLGRGSNVQDNCVLHTDPGFPLELGPDVTVGHMAMLHGCSIGEGSLVGIGAVVLNGAKIGRNCLIGAKSFVAEGKEIPDGSIVLGMPGRIIGQVTDKHLQMMRGAANSYQRRGPEYRQQLAAIGDR
jgi:carbonic anhydrase/acetyltransferase-like protein (isoleucine patch superfamily)